MENTHEANFEEALDSAAADDDVVGSDRLVKESNHATPNRGLYSEPMITSS